MFKKLNRGAFALTVVGSVVALIVVVGGAYFGYQYLLASEENNEVIQLTVTSPQTGDVWAQGHKQTVSWDSVGLKKYNTIKFLLEGGSTTGEFISYQTSGFGDSYTHTFVTPSYVQGKKVLPGFYRLKIIVDDGEEYNTRGGIPTVLAQGVSDPFEIVPESQATTRIISVSITGHGAVKSADGISPVINCPDPTLIEVPKDRTCSADYPLGQTVALVAVPSPGYTFSGWSEVCSGTSTTCNIVVSGADAMRVQASFSD